MTAVSQRLYNIINQFILFSNVYSFFDSLDFFSKIKSVSMKNQDTLQVSTVNYACCRFGNSG